jgi:hypothetical protein
MGVIDFLTIILLAVAIITLVFMGWETSLTRKQMRGEVYSRARVKDLYFLLPATCQREVEGFKQEDEEERSLGEYIAIPVGLERELHICWEMAESQNLRGYRIRFEGNPGNKPEILGMERAFRKKILQTYGSEEFIDWNGDFHREYARQLRCPKGSCHYVALRVRGMAEGKYSMHVRVRMDEAPKPFEGKLTVDCLSQPNDWAEQHWAEEHIR